MPGGGKGARRRYRERAYQRMLDQHSEAVARMRALAEEDLADDDLCRDLALWVRAYRHDHDGQGPFWSHIVRQVRPDLLEELDLDTEAPPYFLVRAYTQHLLRGLQKRRWLSFDAGHAGSTRQGPRLYEEGILINASGTFDREAALRLLDRPSGVRREIWEHLLCRADKHGRVQTTARRIAQVLARPPAKPMTTKRTQNYLAGLRKAGLLITVAEATPWTSRGNTFQLMDKPRETPKPHETEVPHG